MKTVLKHITRNIKEKKGRSILIILSLVIASTVMILNITIPNQIIEANTNKIKSLVGKTDIVVAGFENFDFEDLKKTDEKVNYVGVNQTGIIHKEKTLLIYGTDLSKAYDLELVNSKELNDNEIIINDKAASKFNYKVGDYITISVEDKVYDLKIANILDSKGLLYFKTYSAVLNNKTYNEIFDVKENYSMYYLDILDEKIDEYNKYLKDNNDAIISEKLVDEDEIKDNNAYVQMILIIIFVMAVIMIFFVVNTLNKMIVIERTPVIATFRSIGATKKKMNMILVLENALYGLIGGVIGAICSLLINNMCVKLLLGGESLNTSVPIINLVIGILFSIALEILMSISSIIKSNKYSIKELMFENRSSKYELNKKGAVLSIICIVVSIMLYYLTGDQNALLDLLKIALFWIGVANVMPLLMLILSKIVCFIAKKLNKGSLIIASKNLGFNKMIISSSRLVVIVIAVLLVILNVSKTFDKMLDSFSYQFAGYDIFIKDTSKLDEEYKKLEDVDGIDKVEMVYMTTDEKTKNDDKLLSTPPIFLGMKESRADIEEYDYKIKDLKENEVLVDRVYLNNNKWKIGDYINITFDSIKGTHKFKIVGEINSFYYSVQREVIIVNEEYFKDNFTRVPSQVIIKLDNNVDEENIVKKLEYELKDPDVTILTVENFVKEQRNNIHTIMALFYVIIGLAMMLSFVGIINNQIISFIERTKEFAVLNSICMSKNQLKRMLIIENITSNVTACIIGLVVSAVSVRLMNSVVNGIGLYMDIQFNLDVALMFISIILLTLIITVVMPLMKLRKINVVEAIKYE